MYYIYIYEHKYEEDYIAHYSAVSGMPHGWMDCLLLNRQLASLSYRQATGQSIHVANWQYAEH